MPVAELFSHPVPVAGVEPLILGLRVEQSTVVLQGFQNLAWLLPGNPYRKGMLGTVDLLVLTSLDRLLLIMQTLFTFLRNKLP
jgi:hypothetical protein